MGRSISTRSSSSMRTASNLGVYRKSHIPDGPGYQEKYYFRPGDTGFKVWDTAFGRIGVGICWDQWFPECARAMALMGAEVLFYPTAIGSEPHDATLDTRDPWRRAMQGHAVSNVIPVVAANRIGTETVGAATQTYLRLQFHRQSSRRSGRRVGAQRRGSAGARIRSGFARPPPRCVGFFPRPANGAVSLAARRPRRSVTIITRRVAAYRCLTSQNSASLGFGCAAALIAVRAKR